MKDLIKTKKEFKEFTPTLKDMLCRLYNYIERFRKERTYISFTEEGLYMATSAIEITGRCSEKYAKIFLANLDQIKTLTELQPITTLEITLRVPKGIVVNDEIDKAATNEDYYFTSYSETFETYSIQRYATRIRSAAQSRYYHSHKITLDGRESIHKLTEQV
jgi:hypothetical protein